MDKKYKPDLAKYEKEYDEQNLWTKISRFAKKAGLNTIYYVLLLFNVLQDETTPLTKKAIIWGALGYFITPLDIVPDMIPGAGFLDDTSVLLFALGTLIDSISAKNKMDSKEQLHEFFDFKDEDLDDKFQ